MTQTTTTMTTTNNPAQPLDHNPAAIEGGALNLCSSKDMCNHLCSHARTTPSRLSHCGGYIDTSDDLRHYLYPVCDPKECMSSRAKNEPTTLNQIFKLPVERTISVAQQVGLALKLVKAVLQYHATPWLQPLWRLQDLAYFPTDEGLSASLSTLHISTELSHHNQNLPQHGPDALMTDVSGGGGGGGGINADTSALDDAQLEYGIRNLTMHSLGVALLQIGQWDLLRPDSIVEIRKVASLAERDSRLGPRYQRLTQKCLDCDFGFGKDLAQPELQSAVYRDVVCELEDLVSSLEGR